MTTDDYNNNINIDYKKLKLQVEKDITLSTVASIENSLKVGKWSLKQFLMKLSKMHHDIDKKIIIQARYKCLGIFEIVRLQAYVWKKKNLTDSNLIGQYCQKVNLLLARALLNIGIIHASFENNNRHKLHVLNAFEEGAIVLANPSHYTSSIVYTSI